AIVEALDQAFPTVLTSGSILASAGLLIGFLSSEPTISSIGLFLGKGTIISMILVMCILPQILLLGNKIIERTGFNLNVLPERENYQGYMELSGHVKGHISGTIDAKVDGTIIGDIDAIVESQSIKHKEEADRDER
ncbi:MAG: RND transporter, partial [Epulopiscium sp.]|nr:RND transporter [Candidatus Epulonipiscium sp.]